MHQEIPPGVYGDINGHVFLAVDELAWTRSAPKPPSGQAVVLSHWWGADEAKSHVFRPKIVPHAVDKPIPKTLSGQFAAQYPVRCGSQQLFRYFNDMEEQGGLILEIFDPRGVLIGNVRVPLTRCNRREHVNGWHRADSVDGSSLAVVHVLLMTVFNSDSHVHLNNHASLPAPNIPVSPDVPAEGRSFIRNERLAATDPNLPLFPSPEKSNNGQRAVSRGPVRTNLSSLFMDPDVFNDVEPPTTTTTAPNIPVVTVSTINIEPPTAPPVQVKEVPPIKEPVEPPKPQTPEKKVEQKEEKGAIDTDLLDDLLKRGRNLHSTMLQAEANDDVRVDEGTSWSVWSPSRLVGMIDGPISAREALKDDFTTPEKPKHPHIPLQICFSPQSYNNKYGHLVAWKLNGTEEGRLLTRIVYPNNTRDTWVCSKALDVADVKACQGTTVMEVWSEAGELLGLSFIEPLEQMLTEAALSVNEDYPATLYREWKTKNPYTGAITGRLSGIIAVGTIDQCQKLRDELWATTTIARVYRGHMARSRIVKPKPKPEREVLNVVQMPSVPTIPATPKPAPEVREIGIFSPGKVWQAEKEQAPVIGGSFALVTIHSVRGVQTGAELLVPKMPFMRLAARFGLNAWVKAEVDGYSAETSVIARSFNPQFNHVVTIPLTDLDNSKPTLPTLRLSVNHRIPRHNTSSNIISGVDGDLTDVLIGVGEWNMEIQDDVIRTIPLRSDGDWAGVVDVSTKVMCKNPSVQTHLEKTASEAWETGNWKGNASLYMCTTSVSVPQPKSSKYYVSYVMHGGQHARTQSQSVESSTIRFDHITTTDCVCDSKFEEHVTFGTTDMAVWEDRDNGDVLVGTASISMSGIVEAATNAVSGMYEGWVSRTVPLINSKGTMITGSISVKLRLVKMVERDVSPSVSSVESVKLVEVEEVEEYVEGSVEESVEMEEVEETVEQSVEESVVEEEEAESDVSSYVVEKEEMEETDRLMAEEIEEVDVMETNEEVQPSEAINIDIAIVSAMRLPEVGEGIAEHTTHAVYKWRDGYGAMVTNQADNDVTPVWNHVNIVNDNASPPLWRYLRSGVMVIELRRLKHGLEDHTVIGTTHIPLSALLTSLRELCGWYSVVDYSGANRGHIQLSIKPQRRVLPSNISGSLLRSILEAPKPASITLSDGCSVAIGAGQRLATLRAAWDNEQLLSRTASPVVKAAVRDPRDLLRDVASDPHQTTIDQFLTTVSAFEAETEKLEAQKKLEEEKRRKEEELKRIIEEEKRKEEEEVKIREEAERIAAAEAAAEELRIAYESGMDSIWQRAKIEADKRRKAKEEAERNPPPSTPQVSQTDRLLREYRVRVRTPGVTWDAETKRIYSIMVGPK